MARTRETGQEEEGLRVAAAGRWNHLAQNSTQLSSQKAVSTRGSDRTARLALTVTGLHVSAGLVLCALPRHANHFFFYTARFYRDIIFAVMPITWWEQSREEGELIPAALWALMWSMTQHHLSSGSEQTAS